MAVLREGIIYVSKLSSLFIFDSKYLKKFINSKINVIYLRKK